MKALHLALVMLPLLITAIPMHTQSQSATPRISWIVSSNPSSGVDNAHSVCVMGDYIFVVGNYNVSSGDLAFRIEKRYKHDGRLVATWVYNPSAGEDSLVDCAVANGMLYVVGTQTTQRGDLAIAIVVLDQNLRLIEYVISNPTEYGDVALAIAVDDEYLYIGGAIDYKSILGLLDVSSWYVEVRRLSHLTIREKSYQGPVTDRNLNSVLGIGVNPVSRDIWSVGVVGLWKGILFEVYGDGLVRILDEGMRLKREVNISDELIFYDVVFDDSGYGYVVGANYMVKLDVYGNEVARAACNYCFGAVLVHDYVYAIGIDTDLLASNILVLRVFDKWLNPITKLELSKGDDFDLALGKIAFDGRYIYIATSSKVGENDYEWIVVSVDTGLIVKHVTITVTTTRTVSYPVTKTVTTEVTSTITTTSTVTKLETETKTLTKPYTTTLMLTLTTTEIRTATEKDWMAIGLITVIAILLFSLGYVLGRKT